MKPNLMIKKIFYVTVLSVLMSFMVACGPSKENSETNSSNNSTVSEEMPEETVTLSHSKLDLSLGDTATLTATVTPADAMIDWKIAEGASVISFDSESGLINAIGIGEATIVAQVGYSRAECKVSVVQHVEDAYSIHLNRTSTQIGVGQTIGLTAMVKLGSTVMSDADIVWSVVEGDSVSVTENGLVTASKEGVSIVNASFVANAGLTVCAECVIKVLPQMEFYQVYPDGMDTSVRFLAQEEVFSLNTLVLNGAGENVNFSEDELIISSETPDTIEYLGNGLFRAIKAGDGVVRVEYKGMDGYCNYRIWHSTKDMFVNVGNGWSGWVKTNEDGKLFYYSQAHGSAVMLTDEAFAEIKQIAEEYGYTKLVATLYYVEGSLYNVFDSDRYATNANSVALAVKKSDTPVRYTLDYETFKDWAELQMFFSIWADTDITFTLTLEKYGITAEDRIEMEGDTFTFDDINAVVTGRSGTLEGLTYEDFTVTSLNPNVVSYENGVFTAEAGGDATICVDYMGCITYISIKVLGSSYNLPADMLMNVGYGYGGEVSADDEGMLHYSATNPEIGSAISLTDTALESIKQMAEGYGYTKLVVTLYQTSGNLLNIFDEWNLAGNGNVSGMYNDIGEDDDPIRVEIAYNTFKEWTEMQILFSMWSETEVMFSLTLEKGDIEENNPSMPEIPEGAYVVPFSMYSVSEEYGNNSGLHKDMGNGQVQIIQHPSGGWYALEITGENWGSLKALAEANGYTKLVLNILDYTELISLGGVDTTGYPALEFIYEGRYENNLADYANQDKLVVIVANTYWELSSAESVTFMLTLEKGEEGETEPETFGDVYTVAFSMFTIDPNNPHGSIKGNEDGSIQMVQNATDGYYGLQIAGDNWTALKAIAAEQGYTKLVLFISEGSAMRAYDINGADKLQMDYDNDLNKRHVNNIADYADLDAVTVLLMNTYWEYGAQSVTLTLTLEK